MRDACVRPLRRFLKALCILRAARPLRKGVRELITFKRRLPVGITIHSTNKEKKRRDEKWCGCAGILSTGHAPQNDKILRRFNFSKYFMYISVRITPEYCNKLDFGWEVEREDLMTNKLFWYHFTSRWFDNVDQYIVCYEKSNKFGEPCSPHYHINLYGDIKVKKETLQKWFNKHGAKGNKAYSNHIFRYNICKPLSCALSNS